VKEELAVLLQKGFLRVYFKGVITKIEDVLEDKAVQDIELTDTTTIRILIDRIVVNEEEETISRIADSVQTAFFEGKGDCFVEYEGTTNIFLRSFRARWG
jgi:excinuclease ABC subunit A